jgi:stage V sporulation protein AC
MANEQRKLQTKIMQEYYQLEKKNETKRPVVQNCLRAFLVGGIICSIGQAIQFFYMYFFHLLNKPLEIRLLPR